MDKVTKNNYKDLSEIYKHKAHVELARLDDGSIIIGEAVDENNKLLYVIKRGNEITTDYAKGKKVIVGIRQSKWIKAKKLING